MHAEVQLKIYQKNLFLMAKDYFSYSFNVSRNLKFIIE